MQNTSSTVWRHKEGGTLATQNPPPKPRVRPPHSWITKIVTRSTSSIKGQIHVIIGLKDTCEEGRQDLQHPQFW
ncbi:hypothetical protein NPIL_487511 [Nephila pilipes]|uniref:Uncharacterized protein n=1 Tax=Nephila pilipes TaxID=299642 RepID=A0A8X6TS35_NEPPI|nr:hypothetical protein NPIL_487511 [Nephila pilipes]